MQHKGVRSGKSPSPSNFEVATLTNTGIAIDQNIDYITSGRKQFDMVRLSSPLKMETWEDRLTST